MNSIAIMHAGWNFICKSKTPSAAFFAIASNISYIVAFRQVSILIGVLLGIFVLKEKSNRFKITGTALIFAGLVLAALG